MREYWKQRSTEGGCGTNENPMPTDPVTAKCTPAKWKAVTSNFGYIAYFESQRPAHDPDISSDLFAAPKIPICYANVGPLGAPTEQIMSIADPIADLAVPKINIPRGLFETLPLQVGAMEIPIPENSEEDVCASVPAEDRGPISKEDAPQLAVLRNESATFSQKWDANWEIQAKQWSSNLQCYQDLFSSALAYWPDEIYELGSMVYHAGSYLYGVPGRIWDAWEEAESTGAMFSDAASAFATWSAEKYELFKQLPGMLVDSFLKTIDGLQCLNRAALEREVCTFLGGCIASVIPDLILLIFSAGAGNAVKWCAQAAMKIPKVEKFVMAAKAVPGVMRATTAIAEVGADLAKLKKLASAKVTKPLEGLGVPSAIANEAGRVVAGKVISLIPGGKAVLYVTTGPDGRQVIRLLVKNAVGGIPAATYEVTKEQAAEYLGVSADQALASLLAVQSSVAVYKYLKSTSPTPRDLTWMETDPSGSSVAKSTNGKLYLRKGGKVYEVLDPYDDKLSVGQSFP